YARSKTVKPLHAPLARRTLLCVDPMASPHPRPLGVLRPELPRIRPACLPRRPLQAILRYVLICLNQRANLAISRTTASRLGALEGVTTNAGQPVPSLCPPTG